MGNKVNFDPMEQRAVDMFHRCRFHREKPNRCYALKELLCIKKYRCSFYQPGPVKKGTVSGLRKEKEKNEKGKTE